MLQLCSIVCLGLAPHPYHSTALLTPASEKRAAGRRWPAAPARRVLLVALGFAKDAGCIPETRGGRP